MMHVFTELVFFEMATMREVRLFSNKIVTPQHSGFMLNCPEKLREECNFPISCAALHHSLSPTPNSHSCILSF